jgi:four helix bundle protein
VQNRRLSTPQIVRGFVAKLGIVNEESDESVYWLELMRDGNIGDRREFGLLLPEAKELRAIFAASCRTARRSRNGGGKR